MRLEHIKCLAYILREIIMQQKPSNSNVNNQFVTITDEARAKILEIVDKELTLELEKWSRPDTKHPDGSIGSKQIGVVKVGKTTIPTFVTHINNMKDFKQRIASIVYNKLNGVDKKIISYLFNQPDIRFPNYDPTGVRYLLLLAINNRLIEAAKEYNITDLKKELGWDFESFEAVKEFKKANPIQATPQRKGPMDRFMTPGSSLPSSSNSKPTPTPSRKLGALDKFFTRTPKAVLATSNDSDDNLSSHHSGSSVASTSGHKPAPTTTAAAAAVAVPALPKNDSSVASTSLKDHRNQPAAAAALVVVNPGQNANSVNIAIASSASSTLAIHQFSTPKKATTISLNVSADGRRITQRTTPLSPTRPNNTSTKRTSHVAGLREEDNAGSPYKAPRTKENQLSR
jgi:hypothetical protein